MAATICMENPIDDRNHVLNSTLSTADIFPNEILCAIFSQLIAMDTDLKSGNSAVLAPGWITVSHVCQHWRSVALADPNLWTQISVLSVSKHWLSTMLERSSSSDLSVEISFGVDRIWTRSVQRKIEQVLKGHGSRIAHLWLNTSHINPVLTALPTSVPRLQSLHLICTESLHWHSTFEKKGQLPADRLLDTRILRDLHLSYFHVAWDSHLLRNLTHLKLKLPRIPRANKPTPNQLYDVLNNLTKLVYLELDNVLPIGDKSLQVYFPHTIHFPGLVTLVIKSSTRQVQTFFRSVTISTRTSVNITAETLRPSNIGFIGLISDVTSCYTSPIYDIKFRSFRIERRKCDSERSVLVRLGKEPIAEGDYNILDSPPPHWSLFYVDSSWLGKFPADDVIIFSNFWDGKIFDLRQVTHMLLHFPRITSDALQYVGVGPKVSCIIISEHNARCSMGTNGRSYGTSRGFLSALSNDGDPPGSIKTLPFLPQLTTIHFDRVRFKSTQEASETSYDIDLEELRNCLVHRAIYAPSITRIVMRHCIGVQEADVAFLREKIENVDWDGWDSELYVNAVNYMFTSDCEEHDSDYYSSDEADLGMFR